MGIGRYMAIHILTVLQALHVRHQCNGGVPRIVEDPSAQGHQKDLATGQVAAKDAKEQDQYFLTKTNHFNGYGLMWLKQCHKPYKPSIWEWFVQTTQKYIW